MCDKENSVSLCDVIIAGVCILQESNGVTACEIAEYVAKKRCCKLKEIEGMIKMILCKATKTGILCEKNGQYRINPKYDDLPKVNTDPVNLKDDESENSDDDDDGNDDPCAEKFNPCKTLNFSKENLDDDDDDDTCGAKQQ